MSRKLHFALTVLLCLLLSWGDVFFFGTTKNHSFSELFNQAMHLLTLAIAGVAGYFYWRKSSLGALWLYTYIAVFAFVVLTSALYYLTHKTGFTGWKQLISQVRNNFAGPLPMLVFFLLERFMQQLGTGGNSK